MYYITPAQAKSTIEELFTSTAGESSYTPIQITEEITTRSIIVRGKEKDLDVVDKVIKEIDIRTHELVGQVKHLENELQDEYEKLAKKGLADK